MTRLADRLRADGAAFVVKHAWSRVAPPLERVLAPNRTRTFQINASVPICLPCPTPADRAFVAEQLAELEPFLAADRRVRVIMPYLAGARPDVPPAMHGRVQLIEAADDTMLLSYVSDYSYVVLSDASHDPVAENVRKVLRSFGLAHYPTTAAVEAHFREHDPPPLTGKVKVTYPTYALLAERLQGGHYGFTEPVDWRIVQELPYKFAYLRQHSRIRIVPISIIAGGRGAYGRVARQYAVGKLYGARYFQGESLLDIGCDLCGIKKFVGPQTRYVGVDMQGLADHIVDLDRERLPFEPRSFETVLCFETLEHLNDVHGQLDDMMKIARRYVVASLFIESGETKGRSVNAFGDAQGNAQLPIAPVYDRHQWIFTFCDALDFVYYRARRAGYRIAEVTLFYDDLLFDRRRQVARAFRRADCKALGRDVKILGFVLERADAEP